MFTVIETKLFQTQWPAYWTEDERGEFAAYLSANPDAGNVILEEVVPLTLYAKAKTDNLTGAVLKEIRRALED